MNMKKLIFLASSLVVGGVAGSAIGVHIASEIAFKRACQEASTKQLTKISKDGKEYIVPSYVEFLFK